MRKSHLFPALVVLVAALLAACAPAVTPTLTPPAREYASTVEDATAAAATALQQLEADGYGPYAIDAVDPSSGLVTASLTRADSSLNLSMLIVPIEGGVRITISGTSSDASEAADTASAIEHVYELLSAALPAI